jgi:hypothetical protein
MIQFISSSSVPPLALVFLLSLFPLRIHLVTTIRHIEIVRVENNLVDVVQIRIWIKGVVGGGGGGRGGTFI